MQDLGREPSIDEIAADMEVEPDKVTELRQIAQDPVSLETRLGEEEDSTLGDFVEDTEAVVPVEAAAFKLLQEYVARALEDLNERETAGHHHAVRARRREGPDSRRGRQSLRGNQGADSPAGDQSPRQVARTRPGRNGSRDSSAKPDTKSG